MDGINLSDMKAVIGDGGHDGMDGSWWIIILVLLLCGDGFGGRKHEGYGGCCPPATKDDVCYGFDHQEEMAQLLAIDKDVTCGNFQLEKSILMESCDIKTQMAAGFCDIKETIKDGEIQALRDKLQCAEMSISNQHQTAAILSELGHYATNPPCYPQVQAVQPCYAQPYGYGQRDNCYC